MAFHDVTPMTDKDFQQLRDKYLDQSVNPLITAINGWLEKAAKSPVVELEISFSDITDAPLNDDVKGFLFEAFRSAGWNDRVTLVASKMKIKFVFGRSDE